MSEPEMGDKEKKTGRKAKGNSGVLGILVLAVLAALVAAVMLTKPWMPRELVDGGTQVNTTEYQPDGCDILM